MKYKIKVGNKYLIGESVKDTLKGTVCGDTTAVYSRFVGEMSAYDFCDTIEDASGFDRVTACDYVRGIMERQNYGFYIGEIKLIDADVEETIVHCNIAENAKAIARILDVDAGWSFLDYHYILGEDACTSGADRIRSMTDEELAEWLDNNDSNFPIARKGKWLDWLKQEVTE